MVRNTTNDEEFLPFSSFGYHSPEGLCTLIPYTNLRDGDLELEELSRPAPLPLMQQFIVELGTLVKGI